MLRAQILVKLLRDNGALERFRVVLKNVGGCICQVLIFADHVKVSLRVFIEAHTILEINRVLLSFLLTATSLAFFFTGSLANVIIYQFCELSIITFRFAIVKDALHLLTLVLIWRIELESEEFLLYGALKILHRRWYGVYLAQTAHVADFHFSLYCLRIL